MRRRCGYPSAEGAGKSPSSVVKGHSMASQCIPASIPAAFGWCNYWWRSEHREG